MIDIDKILRIAGNKEVKIPEEIDERIEYTLNNLEKLKKEKMSKLKSWFEK